MNRLHNGTRHEVLASSLLLLTFITEHCIDFLRQSAMCHGDVGLITFEWTPNNLIPVANGTNHQCINWEKLDKWTKDRTVDMLQPGWLIHPTLGT